MNISENGIDKVVFASYTSSVVYGCNFSLSEITFQSIVKLLYFKIRYEIKERLKKWESSESLLHISSMLKNISGWKLL